MTVLRWQKGQLRDAVRQDLLVYGSSCMEEQSVHTLQNYHIHVKKE